MLWAMSKLGFDDYVEPLTMYLHRYREMEGDRGAMRGEPPLMMKRTAVDYGVAAFAPPPFHHHAFFGYFKDASSNNININIAAANSSNPVNGETNHALFK